MRLGRFGPDVSEFSRSIRIQWSAMRRARRHAIDRVAAKGRYLKGPPALYEGNGLMQGTGYDAFGFSGFQHEGAAAASQAPIEQLLELLAQRLFG